MLSIVTSCKNRIEFLKSTIDSYCVPEFVSEVIVCDFDSATPVIDQLDLKNRSEKIKIVRVEDQPVWKPGLSRNISVNFVSNPYYLQIDSDVSIVDLEQYFDLMKSGQIDFIRGKHSEGTSSGLVMSTIDAFNSLGGYNDWLVGWGCDDTDFYSRLILSGRGRYKWFKAASFQESPQPMAVKNVNAKKLMSSILPPDLPYAADHKFTTVRNYLVTKLIPQSQKSALRFEYKQIRDNEYQASMPDFNSKFAEIENHIETANLFAAGLYTSKLTYDDMTTNPVIQAWVRSLPSYAPS